MCTLKKVSSPSGRSFARATEGYSSLLPSSRSPTTDVFKKDRRVQDQESGCCKEPLRKKVRCNLIEQLWPLYQNCETRSTLPAIFSYSFSYEHDLLTRSSLMRFDPLHRLDRHHAYQLSSRQKNWAQVKSENDSTEPYGHYSCNRRRRIDP